MYLELFPIKDGLTQHKHKEIIMIVFFSYALISLYLIQKKRKQQKRIIVI